MRALTLLLVLILLFSPAPAFAQDGKEKEGGKREETEKEKEKKKEKKEKDKEKKEEEEKKEPEEKEKEKEKKKDAKKEFLTAIGKSLKAKDSTAIAKHFKPKGKIELKLKGQKDGDYRATQAKGILKSWCEGMDPSTCELKEHKGSYGKFKLKYKIRKNGKSVEATIKVHLEKEGKTWRIKGIVES